MTKTNTEARVHTESKHSAFTFAQCFPGQFDPTIVVATPVSAPSPSPTTSTSSAPTETKKKVKKAEDLSFLDASIGPKAGGGGGKGRK